MLAGAAVGSLLTFGLLNRHAVQANQNDLPPRTVEAPLAAKQGVPENSPTASADPQETPDAQQIAAFQATRNPHVPARPLPTAKLVFQTNGLPEGVTPDAGQSDVYKRLPGVQPPLINRDGRDLGPEAIQMMETRHNEEKPFPGGIPSTSGTPVPFPQTLEEANRLLQGSASPSPAQ